MELVIWNQQRHAWVEVKRLRMERPSNPAGIQKEPGWYLSGLGLHHPECVGQVQAAYLRPDGIHLYISAKEK